MRVTLIWIVAACGTQVPVAPSGSGSARTANPQSDTSSATTRTAPPITQPLSEDQARAEASRLARQAFAARTDIKDGLGTHPPTPAFPPQSFTVEHRDGRWQLTAEPPAGPFARVSFGAFGEQPTVDVGFAVE